MPNKAGRVTESEVALAVMQYLRGIANNEDSIDQIVKELPNFLQLHASDRATSPTRPNEELWEQQVRNIVSHKATAGNAIHDGYLEHRPVAKLYVTNAGRAHLTANGI
ncbi:MAG: hypothetical protein WCS75_08275 [Sphingomonas sp.]|jgi:hypothetical protein|uniref:hypothetical protein n=1 Tax=Sphingomonas sp. TaxID=28214 RepID=UPI0035655DE0